MVNQIHLMTNPLNFQQELMLRDAPSATTGLDPFLSGLNDHSRQESADSGLGLGNNYSLPHTPDDFLSTMDDNMDGVSGEPEKSTLRHHVVR